MTYVPTSTGAHGREEEEQWARVVAGDPVHGVVLIFIQKLCTAFHEFEPAWEHRAVTPESLAYYRDRLAGRMLRVIQVMEANGLVHLDGVEALRDLLQRTRDAESLQELASLAEPEHQVAHRLTDALERAGQP